MEPACQQVLRWHPLTLRRAIELSGDRLERPTTARYIDLACGPAGAPRVGKYGVDLATLERIALPALRRPADVIVIDELGKMGLASAALRLAVSGLFDAGGATIIATVHAGAHPFVDGLLRRPDVEVLRVTERTRDRIPAELAARLVGRP